MKNYYEQLEVDKEASIEVIDKAYKVLAKKYHPDIHPEDKKEWAEEQFKKINEAYEVLSNEEKRRVYDQELAVTAIDYHRKYEELCREQEILKQQLQDLKNRSMNPQNYYTSSTGYQQNYQNHINPQSNYQTNYTANPNVKPSAEEMRKQEFSDAYHGILEGLGKFIRQRRTLKDFIAFALTILLLILIILILWQIPFTRKYLLWFYQSNAIIKIIVDMFIH